MADSIPPGDNPSRAAQGSTTIEQKRNLRRLASNLRDQQSDKTLVSRQAIQRLITLYDFRMAETVLWYIDSRSELKTRDVVRQQLAEGAQVVVPYCTVNQQGESVLGLWRLRSLEELTESKWKILEPPSDQWQDEDRVVLPDELDAVICPGVAFDQLGARLGSGYGYYDRLLAGVRPDCIRIGLCYECQLLDKIPTEPHDRLMHWVVTESRASATSMPGRRI